MLPSIAIDATHLDNPSPTGVEWYTQELLRKLVPGLICKGVRVLLISHNPNLVIPEGAELVHSPHVSFWSRRALPKLLKQLRPTLYFTPSGIPPVRPGCATACMVHDMSVYREPKAYRVSDRYRLTHLSRQAVRNAACVFTPSEFTKQEVQRIWGIPAERIIVTPLGVPSASARLEPIPGVHDELPVLAYIGRVERKKNIRTLVEACSKLTTPVQLVLAGKPGYGYAAIERQISELPVPIRSRIHCTGFISAEQKGWLLSRADVVLVPSEYEGFGIPVLEALQAGVPVICADAGALPEVAGSAAKLVPGQDVAAWAGAIEIVLQGGESVHAQVTAGHQRVASYTWTRTSDLTLQALLDILL